MRADGGRANPRVTGAWVRGIILVVPAVALFAGSAPAPAAPPPAAPTAIAVSAGSEYTCAITSAGGAECWGYNNDGELGDNSTNNASTAVPVSGLSSGVAEIAAGGTHACALTTAQTVDCWGYNGDGELGQGFTGGNSLMPDRINGLSALAISAGLNHTCALTSGRGVDCWGYNGDGEIGDGGVCGTLCSTPVTVSGLSSGVVAIASGDSHNCALTSAGKVDCWGQNINGQLGDGATAASQTTPVEVSGLTGVVAIADGGQHTCALTSAGGVECWGANNVGQLGDGTTTRRLTPVAVEGLSSGVVAIAAGENHSCALMGGGAVECWGYDSDGQLGNGTTTDSTTPVRVSGLSGGVVAIAAGGAHTCALTGVGGIDCWGVGGFGQLGDAATTDRWLPTITFGFGPGAAAVSGGGAHTCALTTGGQAECWGANTDGQLGDGTTTNRTAPVRVAGLSGGGTVAVASGASHTCAVTSAGGVECWGYDGDGELGNGSTNDSSTAVPVSGLSSGTVAIASGASHTCAVTSAGGVECWGYDGDGELGNGSTTSSDTPVVVSGLSSGVVAVSAGDRHTCALTTGGGVECWGDNTFGQLGNGTTTGSSTPVAVSGLSSGVVAIGAGGYESCALTSAGGVECWGDNAFGQLGNGTTTDSDMPVDVSGLSGDVAAISVGEFFSCALASSSGVDCWGLNGAGQVGDGTTTNRSTPTAVSGLTSGVAAIAAGTAHTCALTNAAGLECWGENSSGQLGDGATTTSQSTPVEVSGFQNPRTLTVTRAGSGSGSVTSSPGGIDCGSGCSQIFSYGSSVTLTASPDAGARFAGWSGGGCSGTGTCTVSLSADQTVTATFNVPRSLTVTKAGNGTGTVASSPAGIACGASCATQFDLGTTVTLAATPATGSSFAGWSGGGCSGSGACSVTLDDATAVTATFDLLAEKLDIARKGKGGGTVTSVPAGISCGKTCEHAYVYGTTVLLKAKAARGSSFVGWSGACRGAKSCAVGMTKTTSVSAAFGKDCLVPQLKGKTLSGAKRALRSHDCSVGKITHARSGTVNRGRVVGQKPKPRKRLPHGAKVRLVLGKSQR